MVGHKYTDEEHKFLQSFIPGHTYKEIVAEYNKRFEEPITESRVKGYMANHKINNGLTGRFKKGNIPFNKGKKGVCAKGCEKTWFAEGHLPHNTKPVGYERITRDGYIEVKIKMRPSHPSCNDNFKLKHRLVWEEAHGPIPEGCNIIFLDGNRQNCDLENLAIVTKAEHQQMTRRGLRSENPQMTVTGMFIARAGVICKKKKKEKNNMNKLTYINIDELYSHPDNPRKEIRDIEELVESIKVKGVMQNLTVVKGHYYEEDGKTHWSAEKGYTVIIGHRRMTAARLAGLKELPCVVVQMEYKDQIATMLLENIQRNDLTVYEQAKGFQMMLDLGDSVEKISEKSGFSQTTIRRRVKLAELDEEKLKKASERQITLLDLDKLNKVEDIKERNNLLDSIGTPNFNNAVRRVIDREERERNTAKWRKVLLGLGLKEIDYGHCWDYGVCETNFMNFAELDEIEEFKLNGDEKYFAINYGAVYFRKDKEKESQKEDAAERRKRAKREKANNELREATERAYNLRREFVFSISESVAKENISIISEFLIRKEWSKEGSGGYYMRYNRSNFVSKDENISEYKDISDVVNNHPYQSLLRHAYVLWADGKQWGYRNYSGGYAKDERIDYIYDVLCRLGYEMSDEEKQLQDGTHPLFKIFEQ